LDSIEHEFTNHTEELDQDHFSGRVIAIFNTEKEANEFKSKTQTNDFSKIIQYFKSKEEKLDIKEMHVEPANEPSDLIWENMEYTYGQRMERIFVVFLLSLALMIGSFFILYLLTQLQLDNKNEDQFTKQILSLVFTISINIINYVVSTILIKVTE
jgi:hypothetical protein